VTLCVVSEDQLRLKGRILMVLLGSSPNFIIAAAKELVSGLKHIEESKYTIAKGTCYPRPTSDENRQLRTLDFLQMWDNLNGT